MQANRVREGCEGESYRASGERRRRRLGWGWRQGSCKGAGFEGGISIILVASIDSIAPLRLRISHTHGPLLFPLHVPPRTDAAGPLDSTPFSRPRPRAPLTPISRPVNARPSLPRTNHPRLVAARAPLRVVRPIPVASAIVGSTRPRSNLFRTLC
ncbi:hypothetical protein B0H16DRAFT_244584 [Mycena metata]|uniref:Uncharacterized protein n=1 Tax=Mycena metata TaxID=1033252 RepID=A0AAD7MS23_9AGAR|nr:hypothetical protein B0H16DRAFT_244584 [Mycena metata]